MKKIAAAVIVLLAVLFTGCIPDSLTEYKKAAERTREIKKGRTQVEYSLAMDFNTEGMTKEQIKELSYFGNIKGSFDTAFDNELKRGIARNYLNFGGLGFDMDLYANGEEVFMKLPVVGKYLRLDSLQDSVNKEKYGGDMELISGESKNEIGEEWLGMLKKEDIFKGRNIVLTTPEGEVKTREYTIKLKDEQIKTFAAEAVDILSGDEKLRNSYEKLFKKNINSMKDISFEKLVSDIKEDMKSYMVENFSYTAHVDIDGYIVNEMIELSIRVNNTRPASVTGVSCKLDIRNWDINREQEFKFPVLTEENTLEMDEADNLFNNKD